MSSPGTSLVTGETAEQARNSARISSAFRRLPESAALAIVLIVLCIILSTTSPYFLQWSNWVNILEASAVTGIVAAPGTLLLISGNFDLSVGAGAAFCGVIFAKLLITHGLTIAILAGIGCGLGIGAVNGFIVVVLGVNSLIATLGTLGILQGLADVMTQGNDVPVNGFTGLGSARPLLQIPVPVLILVVVLVLFAVVLRFTVFGRGVYAIGANRGAARLAGIHVGRTVFIGFVLSGLAVALSALILTSQISAGSPSEESTLNLTVVTAIVLGGTALQGGKGTILGMTLGVLILGVVSNGLTLAGVNSFWQSLIQGVLLIAAVALDRLRVKLGVLK